MAHSERVRFRHQGGHRGWDREGPVDGGGIGTMRSGIVRGRQEGLQDSVAKVVFKSYCSQKVCGFSAVGRWHKSSQT